VITCPACSTMPAAIAGVLGAETGGRTGVIVMAMASQGYRPVVNLPLTEMLSRLDQAL